MATHLQGSLFDQSDTVQISSLEGTRQVTLGTGAWIDLQPGWLSGADTLFAHLAEGVP